MAKTSDLTQFKAFSGLRNDVDPERFGPSELVTATNVNIDKTGAVARREGYTLKIGAAAHSLWSNGRAAFYVADDKLFRLNDDFSAVVLRSNLTPLARMSFCEAANRIFYTNGHETGVVDDGAARSWGLPIPPLPGVVVGTGLLPAGTYQYVMVYQRRNGQDSGAPTAGTITVADGSSLMFIMPPSTDPTVISKQIYLSTANGETMYQAIDVANDQVTDTYAGDTSEFALDLNSQFMSPAPAGQLVAYYKGRMFVAAGDVLYYSQPFAFEWFDLRNYIQLDSKITLLATLEEKDSSSDDGGLFIGTENTIGVLTGAAPENFQYLPKQPFGAVLGALDYVDGNLFEKGDVGSRALPMFLSTQGICVGLPGMEIKNLTRSKYGFKAAGEGAALFMPGPNRFIAVSNY